MRPPYRAPNGADILRRIQEASSGSSLVGLSFWADSALTGLAQIPSVLYGPIGHGAHAIDEWVSGSSLLNVYEVLKKVLSPNQ
jgi:acetylornithine deacetylase/succinyl-diaminopimelate desuccinylase-like protein